MTQPMSQTEIQNLAAVYTDASKNAVTADEWNEIVTLNEIEYKRALANRSTGESDYDATHDYVDANHYLCAAYAEIYGHEPSLDDQSMCDLSAAVDYALRTFFKKV